jgi:nitrogen fixation NifU-like protein
MQLESMYQEIILDHYRNPHHAGLREPFDAEAYHVNPTEGDEVMVRVTLSDSGSEPVLADVSYQALGCMISQASVSVMTDLVIGKTVSEAMAISEAFLNLMRSRGDTEPDEDMLEDAVAFAGISRYPRRIRCALLCWMAWKDAMARAVVQRDERIIERHLTPLHAGLREPFDAQVHHVNPDDEDEVTVRVTLSDSGSEPVLADVSYRALGCSVSMASVSLMADILIGKTVSEATDISEAFLNLMQPHDNIEPDEDMLGDAVVFAKISKYPSRIKCALLGWMAWRDATARALSQLD